MSRHASTIARHRNGDHTPEKSSPLRNSPVIVSHFSNTVTPTRSHTLTSTSTVHFSSASPGQKRRVGDTSPTRQDLREMASSGRPPPEHAYRSVRESLRPLSQAPYIDPSRTLSRAGSRKYDDSGENHNSQVDYAVLQRDSLLSTDGSTAGFLSRDNEPHASSPTFITPELSDLKSSSTSYLRTLSKLASQGDQTDFDVTSRAPVVGLSGRRQLKRAGSVRDVSKIQNQSNSQRSAWAETNWMEKQRQFVQAYEYLCHIGEAKEWIEKVITTILPPIVQLEEALRNGVTLAEIVQVFYPERRIRIFRNPKLQFRHSDNIALFFDFLAEMELPELFRFELIDLYEKKNIPKVIYCVHALSWLLFRKGLVDFKIGNLLGQLEFEHHELEAMQRGLDKAGVSMPSFAGVGDSFGAEKQPLRVVETEEERIANGLAAADVSILDLQGQMRGSLVRLQLGSMMQSLWNVEPTILDLQSQVRGKWAREISSYRASMRNSAISIQSFARGFLTRRQQSEMHISMITDRGSVTLLQSLVRATQGRRHGNLLHATLAMNTPSILCLQSLARGNQRRTSTAILRQKAKETTATGSNIAVAIKGYLVRRRLAEELNALQAVRSSIETMQARLKGAALRRVLSQQDRMLHRTTANIDRFQAHLRGYTSRQRVSHLKLQLSTNINSIVSLQGLVRAMLVRKTMQSLDLELRECQSQILHLQSHARRLLVTRTISSDLRSLDYQSGQITKLQSIIRAKVARYLVKAAHTELSEYTEPFTLLQSLARAMAIRLEIDSLLCSLEDEDDVIASLQAQIRGMIIRRNFAEKQRFFKKNMEKVVKVQSFIRARLQGEAYKSLTSGVNPPVTTVKNFVHLLNDSDFDFDEEIEFERLRKTVVQHVRQNEMADQYITQLDIKIALLVKNKITLDEVVKHQKHFGGAAGNLLTRKEMDMKDQLDLKALNKTSRQKLEQYQDFFFMLQTQPQYLARVFSRLYQRSALEKETERVKQLVMGLFGYAQKRREEYYLVKLLTRSLREEIDSCPALSDYTRGKFFSSKLFSAYVKSPRDRKYFAGLLQPVIKESILENPDLDLESDPMQIYLSAIENEELRTGQRSRRSPDIPREAAIRDPETKRLFITHLQDLRDIADHFFLLLEEQIPRMPFGVRYFAQQMYQLLSAKYPHDEQGHILQIVGQWIWKSYLQPALLEPEKFGVVDRGLSQEHRRNLGEVCKVVGQVATGRLFGGENVFLRPLNSYVSESIERLGHIWSRLIEIPSAESHFEIDEFNDLYSRTKPTLYMKLSDIFAVHQLVAAEAQYICSARDDSFQAVIHGLGNVKNNESELRGVGDSEVCLTLNPKLHESEDPEAEIKSLFTETKRCVLYVIRVQSGRHLLEVMVKPITTDDEDRWDIMVRNELTGPGRKKGAYAEASTLTDLSTLSYPELKRTALENIIQLERYGRLSRHNQYQDLLNAIAVDIRTKHRRRIQRQKELESVRSTLSRLNEQAIYLEGQLRTYNDYVEQAMVTLQNKKGKKRFLLPFTKQWDHERELARSGRVPKFGSYKYSAQDLANRGILLSWAGFSERQYAHLDLTISSNEVGVFALEGSNGPISIPGATAQLPLDDLLQAQFNNTQALELFDESGHNGGGLRVNVNLFVHLIMRKFYKDKD